MADTKISALPASTTPLAGTEAVPLVQSSTTKKVSVSDLTAGRNVSMLQGNATNAFVVTKAGSDTPWVGPHFTVDNGGAGAAERVWAWQLSATDQYDLLNYDGTNWNRWFRFTSAGNLTPMAAAKGFNLTANTPAAGMTSQLLNWYEEGAWTPSDESGAALTFSTALGNYVRIGRQVTCWALVTYPSTANTASATIGGLPFTSYSSGSVRGGGMIGYKQVSALSTIFLEPNDTKATLRTDVGANVTNAQMSGTSLYFCVTYFV